MNTSEKTLWGLLKAHLPKGCHHQRIETGSTGRGIPDVVICHKGVTTWIELKVVMGKRVDLKPEQVAWHWRHSIAGGRVWVLARDRADGPRKGRYDHLYLWSGAMSSRVLAEGVVAPTAALWEAPYDWPDIIHTLLAGPVPDSQKKGSRH